MTRVSLIVLFGFLIAGGFSVHARPHIHIIGSSAIYPFAVAVAEQFSLKTGMPTPVIESTGTGGGIKIFCSKRGPQSPDIVLASRRFSAPERAFCDSRNIGKVLEHLIGRDGITVTAPQGIDFPSLSKSQLRAALVGHIMRDGQRIPNPHKRWSDIAPHLPDFPIRVLGPSSSSGTREAFTQLIFENETDVMRDDGVYVEASDQENVIIQKLQLERHALGIVSFPFLSMNVDRVSAVPIEGVRPTFETIRRGTYPLARPLYLYIKVENLSRIPGLKTYLDEFLSPDAAGADGYLKVYGFIPVDEKKNETPEKGHKRRKTKGGHA